MSRKYEQEREALLEDVKQVLKDAEALYQAAVDDGTEEGRELKSKLKAQLRRAKQQFSELEDSMVERTRQAAAQTNDLVHSNPYQAMGIAALIGLVLGALLSRNSR
ncbi:DUF883 family protein [Zobellella maritima]|uniref:DUF883 family protein n=1 Tax=Zobellella maritima TaxID=2059725 RepID=UPI000E3096D6|nr:DUF883 family protein [Zobellella maritima]